MSGMRKILHAASLSIPFQICLQHGAQHLSADSFSKYVKTTSPSYLF
jgi:hypothetical protein